MRISDWSSDVCSSDLTLVGVLAGAFGGVTLGRDLAPALARLPGVGRHAEEIGSASCRERVCQSVSISVVVVSLKKKNTERTTSTQRNTPFNVSTTHQTSPQQKYVIIEKSHHNT